MKLLGDKLQGGKEALEHLPLREGLRWWKQNSPQSGASGACGVDATDVLIHWLYSALIFLPSQLKIPGEQRHREQGCLSMLSPKPSSGLGMEQAFLEYCSSNPSHT